MAPIEDKDDAIGEQAADAPEDPPIVKALKEVDDRYLALEREYEKEVQELTKKYTEMQRPFLEERRDILTKCDGTPSTGTPALKGFWMQAMQNHPAFEDVIQAYDEDVLEYLVDIVKSNLDEEAPDKGFKITFKFMENPYFSNTELVKEWHTEETNPYCGEMTTNKVVATKIEWKAGKDVTVEKVQKKVKGGGAKKAKQKKEKEEPRPSFFREFFQNLELGMELTKELREQARQMEQDDDEEDDEEDDDEELLEQLLETDREIGEAVRDNIIPFAVRWYTGEAAPEQYLGDDDEDDEEEDDEDDDEDDESSEEAPKGKGKGKGSKKKTSPKPSPSMKPSEQPKEECKQQ